MSDVDDMIEEGKIMDMEDAQERADEIRQATKEDGGQA